MMKTVVVALLMGALLLTSALVKGARVSDVANTKHNLSANAPNSVKAASEGSGGTTEICVFCHTPHGSNTNIEGPLWNRSANQSTTYDMYSSSSLDAGVLSAPGGSSKLCLTCHDGTVAIGSVLNKPGSGTDGTPLVMLGTDAGMMPAGDGADTGFTRRLGFEMKNDHPISITLNDDLSALDGELRHNPASVTDRKQEYVVGGTTIVGNRAASGLTTKPKLPLEATGTDATDNGDAGNGIEDGQVQCASCHDPHIRETDMSDTGPALGQSIKFLRLNRFQLTNPGATFNKDDDIICLACHDKAGWRQSAHALGQNPGEPADDRYKNITAVTSSREFLAGMPVYKAACLNCHDAHTETGAERILREGADSSMKPAIEETCYQCHSDPSTLSIIEGPTGGNTQAPNIKTEFTRSKRMPITTAQQPAIAPVHDITDKDFSETQANLGTGTGNLSTNRHVECTDCHNPHRVIRNSLFNGLGDDTKRTHAVSGTSTGNIASGALRGTWGVDPSTAGNASWTPTTAWPNDTVLSRPYQVKKGDPGTSTSTARSNSYLTREYQLCFKCHSDYGMEIDNLPNANTPLLGYATGSTPYGTNSMTQYTNVAAEFASVNATNPPSTNTDQGEQDNTGSACGGSDCDPTPSEPGDNDADRNDDFNHRSWHPVMWPTGRDRAERAMHASEAINLLAPFASNVGTQTMTCSDCHGSDVAWTQANGHGTGPNTSAVQGPHGSNNDFLLKGTWGDSTKLPDGSGSFCANCHKNTNSSGFFGNHRPDDKMGGEECMYCHIAVPHGWKNKAFLANLLCVGKEGGATTDCKSVGDYENYNAVIRAPYYNNSRLRVPTWKKSGSWSSAACGGRNMEDGCPRTD